MAQLDGSKLEQVRKDAQRPVSLHFRSADVEDHLDGATAVHKREEVRRPRIEPQERQPLRSDGKPRNSAQGQVWTNFAPRPCDVVFAAGLPA